MGSSSTHVVTASGPTGVIRRQCSCGAPTKGGKKCDSCEKKKVALQAKLEVESGGDALEHEADRAAEQVMASGQPSVSDAIEHANGAGFARDSAGAGGGGGGGAGTGAFVGRRRDAGVRLSRASGASGATFDAPSEVSDVLRTPGQPLAPATRNFMESRFGHDFGAVRIHSGDSAARAASSIQARAFTHQSQIVFGRGHYSPGSHAGRLLLAHELSHVVQQGGAIRRAPDPQTSGDIQCRTDRRHGEEMKRPWQIYAYCIWMTAHQGDEFQSLVERETKSWIRWRFGDASPEVAAKLYELVRKSPVQQIVRGIQFRDRCQYGLGLSPEVYTTLVRIGDAGRKQKSADNPGGARDKAGGAGAGGTGGSGQNAGDQKSNAAGKGSGTQADEGSLLRDLAAKAVNRNIAMKDVGTLGIRSAVTETEEIKTRHEPTTPVRFDSRIFKGEPELSKHFLETLEHFTGRPITAEDLKAAAPGFSEADYENIVKVKQSYRMLGAAYSQGWLEYSKKAHGTEKRAFFILIEAVLEQLARGNPTAAANALEIGRERGMTGDEGKIGIRHRWNGWLLYDENGAPMPAISGIGFRDKGYVGSRVNPEGKLTEMFLFNIENIEDPGLRSLLNTVRMTISDPTRATAQAADFLFDNIEIVNREVLADIPEKVLEQLKDSLKFFVGFILGEAVSSILMKARNPWLVGLGLALKGLLKTAEYLMDIEFIGTVMEKIQQAGQELIRVEMKPGATQETPIQQRFTTLSRRHIEAAKKPIKELLIEIGVMGAMLAGGGVFKVILKNVRGGKRGQLRCNTCSISAEGETATRKSVEAEGKAEARDAHEGAAEGKPAEPPPELKGPEAKAPETKAPEAKAGEAKPTEAKPGEAKAPEVQPGEAKPGEAKAGEAKPGEAKAGESKAGETDAAAAESKAQHEAAQSKFEKARDRAERFVNLALAYEKALAKFESLKNQSYAKNDIKLNESVREAQAQRDGYLNALKEEFGVQSRDQIAARRNELVGDYVDANREFTPLDIKHNPAKHRARMPCFSRETTVHTPSGARPIATLRPGDIVLSHDFETGCDRPARVLNVIEGYTQRFFRVSSGSTEIRATSRHLFWGESPRGWIEARHLAAGMSVHAPEGRSLSVDAIEGEQVDSESTFNLTLEDHHTYYVGPGLLVHNEGVDAKLGGSWIIYKLTLPGSKAVYIGQTTATGAGGVARGEEARLLEHVKEAMESISAIEAELKTNPSAERRAKLERNLEFFKFKGKAQVEVLVYGIGTKAQADWLEQRNIDIEMGLVGEANVMNRRNQISRDRLQEVAIELMKDPRVAAQCA